MSLRSLFAFCATKDIGIKENLNQRQKTLEEVLDPENLCKDMKKKTIQEACGISVHAHYQKGDFTYATDFIGAEEIRKE